MTDRLYYDDAYLLEFEARIVEVGEHKGGFYTVLDRSAFYPTSGGQSNDTGLLNEIEIIDVVENDSGEVLHISKQPVGKIGDGVVGAVDAERRKRYRQQHTAQHILSQTFVKLYDMETISVHLGEEYGAIELETKSLSPEQLSNAESYGNGIVQSNLPVEIMSVESDQIHSIPLRKVPTRYGSLRVVRIGEFDYSACGGTHCRTTAEVGLLKIAGIEKMRGRTLVRFLSGIQAVDDYSRRFAVTDQLSKRLTCHVGDLVEKIDKLQAENRSVRKSLEELRRELLPTKAKELAARAEKHGRHRLVFEDLGSYDQRLVGQLAGQAADLVGGMAVLYVEGRLTVSTSSSSGLDAGRLAKLVCDATGLRGGGNERQAQLGGADRERLRQYKEAFIGLLADDNV